MLIHGKQQNKQRRHSTETCRRSELNAARQERITEFLKGKGWKLSEHPFNTFLISPDSEWSVEIEKNGYWYAGRFTDSDVETEWGLVAQGRYENDRGRLRLRRTPQIMCLIAAFVSLTSLTRSGTTAAIGVARTFAKAS